MTNGNDNVTPMHPNTTSNADQIYKGLTKREYFAAMAMQAILSNPKFSENAREMAIQKGIPITDNAPELIQPFAHLAITCADTLISELNKQTSEQA
jgi:hypothetical protein